MHIHKTAISGVFQVHLEPIRDGRGFFARTWCQQEFALLGVGSRFTQASVSYNVRKGTVRGLHFQHPPSLEGKLVRCERGSAHDVVLDLRPLSPTFLHHVSIELDERAGNALYIPPGIAHGFQTLVDECVIQYTMTDFYQPALADGVRWNDPAFGISWPLEVTVISERDHTYPDFDLPAHEARWRSAFKP